MGSAPEDQHRYHQCDVLPPLRNIKEKNVTARQENVNLLIMWSPAAHGITVTFLCFQCFDYLLSHPLHSSKVNEAKQERSRKVSQRNADLLTEPKECKRNAEPQEYVKYSCITDMLEQTHTHISFRKFCCTWGGVPILSQVQKAAALVNQKYYSPIAEVLFCNICGKVKHDEEGSRYAIRETTTFLIIYPIYMGGLWFASQLSMSLLLFTSSSSLSSRLYKCQPTQKPCWSYRWYKLEIFLFLSPNTGVEKGRGYVS